MRLLIKHKFDLKNPPLQQMGALNPALKCERGGLLVFVVLRLCLCVQVLLSLSSTDTEKKVRELACARIHSHS